MTPVSSNVNSIIRKLRQSSEHKTLLFSAYTVRLTRIRPARAAALPKAIHPFFSPLFGDPLCASFGTSYTLRSTLYKAGLFRLAPTRMCVVLYIHFRKMSRVSLFWFVIFSRLIRRTRASVHVNNIRFALHSFSITYRSYSFTRKKNYRSILPTHVWLREEHQESLRRCYTGGKKLAYTILL